MGQVCIHATDCVMESKEERGERRQGVRLNNKTQRHQEWK